MIGVALLLLVLGVVLCAAWCAPPTEEDLRKRQRRAELSIDNEAESAKRAMNDAAGQSWRNLVD